MSDQYLMGLVHAVLAFGKNDLVAWERLLGEAKRRGLVVTGVTTNGVDVVMRQTVYMHRGRVFVVVAEPGATWSEGLAAEKIMGINFVHAAYGQNPLDEQYRRVERSRDRGIRAFMTLARVHAPWLTLKGLQGAMQWAVRDDGLVTLGARHELEVSATPDGALVRLVHPYHRHQVVLSEILPWCDSGLSMPPAWGDAMAKQWYIYSLKHMDPDFDVELAKAEATREDLRELFERNVGARGATNPGDEDLRDLERRAAAGDKKARIQLRRERKRRGVPDPLWKGAKKLSRRVRGLQDSWEVNFNRGPSFDVRMRAEAFDRVWRSPQATPESLVAAVVGLPIGWAETLLSGGHELYVASPNEWHVYDWNGDYIAILRRKTPYWSRGSGRIR